MRRSGVLGEFSTKGSGNGGSSLSCGIPLSGYEFHHKWLWVSLDLGFTWEGMKGEK